MLAQLQDPPTPKFILPPRGKINNLQPPPLDIWDFLCYATKGSNRYQGGASHIFQPGLTGHFYYHQGLDNLPVMCYTAT